MVSKPGPCWCCRWKSSTTSGSMDLGRGLQSYPFCPLDRHQPSSAGDGDHVGVILGLADREPGRVCLHSTPARLPTIPGALLGGLPDGAGGLHLLQVGEWLPSMG